MQSQRQFEIIYMLLRSGRITAANLAERLEVSVRTIYRDLDALSAAGIPVYATKGKNGGVALMEGFVLDRAALTEEELRQIQSALSAMQATRAPGAQAMQKLEAFLSPSDHWLEIDFANWGEARAIALEALREAILNKQVVRFHYWGRDGGENEREAEPLMLSYRDRAWYLKAFCLLRGDFRIFKLNRMQEIVLTDQVFDRAYHAQDFASILQINTMPIVQLDLCFAARTAYRVLDEFASDQVARNADGSFRVRVAFPEDDWVYTFLMSFGQDVRILSPEHVRRAVRKMHAAAAGTEETWHFL